MLSCKIEPTDRLTLLAAEDELDTEVVTEYKHSSFGEHLKH